MAGIMSRFTPQKPLKAVWFCSFNPDYIKGKKPRFISGYSPNILAPWIDLLLDEVKVHKNVRVHLISTYYKLVKDFHYFEDNVSYHLISQKMPFFRKTYPPLWEKMTGYYILRRKIEKIINNIEPDIIHYHGSDLDATQAFRGLGIPSLLTPVTFMDELYQYFPTKENLNRLQREQWMFKKEKHFGIRANFMKHKIESLNPEANFHWHNYPIRKPNISAEQFPEKDSEIVFAARLNQNKGIEDLIQAVGLLMRDVPAIRIKVIGDSGNPDYYSKILNMVEKLGLQSHFQFMGKVDSQEELFTEIAKAKVYVLPTYFDMIPGTIIESMYIGTPVVTYPVGGIPDLNLNGETVLFAERGNVPDLASKILRLLNEKQYSIGLSRAAMKYVSENYSNEKAASDILTAYERIIESHV